MIQYRIGFATAFIGSLWRAAHFWVPVFMVETTTNFIFPSEKSGY